MPTPLIRLRSDPEPRPRRRHPRLRLTLLVVFLIFTALLVERLRGQWALSTWKEGMSANGEVFNPERIWPEPSPQGLAFSNQLHAAVARLPQRLNPYAGRFSPIVLQEPGLARRGSHEPSPLLPHMAGSGKDLATASWSDLELAVREAQPALQSLRTLLKNPPADIGYAILPRLEALNFASCVNVRHAAQALQAAAMSNLHQGDLASAHGNLLALASFTKVYSAEPSLVNYMVRMAILNLGIETAWDALQADGWTEPQLGALQQAFQCEPLLAQLPRTIEAERAARLFELNWCSSHSYLTWARRHEELWQCFGQKPPNRGACYYREWLFHPLWKFAWADQETLAYLRQVQQEIDILREGVKTGAGCELVTRTTSVLENYRPPPARWRFYLSLPLAGGMGAGKRPDGGYQYPYAFFTRAWSISMRNLTLSQMLTAAIAVKRYELREGKPPASLEALVPDLAGKVPRDFMNGQALHYVLHGNGSYLLYSVADNGRDDQGSAAVSPDAPGAAAPWNTRDLVWPRAAGAAAIAPASGLASHVRTKGGS